MPEFKSKEEYEKWKGQRISILKANPNALKEVARAKSINMGEYLHGFSTSKSVKGVQCKIDENDFIFNDSYEKELGRIPRNMINQVDIADKTQVTRAALNPAGLLIGGTLGAVITSAGHEIKNKKFSIEIEWGNTKGLKNTTV